MQKKTILALIFLFFPSAFCRAGAGADGADFLRVTPDSRSAALGNSGVADPGSGFAVHHNPALLGMERDRLRLSGSQTDWLGGLRAAHYAADLRWGRWAAGVFMSQWSSGAFGATDAEGNAAGDLEYRALNTGAAVSRAVGGGLRLGAAAKRISQSFTGAGDAGASAAAWDAGLAWDTPLRGLRAGAAARNLGGRMVFDRVPERLPTNFSAGVEGRLWAGRLTWSVEGQHDREKTAALKAGASFSPLSSLALRVGYDTLVARSSSLVGLTSGLGFRLGGLAVDYAFAPFGTLGAVQRISVSWRLGNVRPAPGRAPSGKKWPGELRWVEEGR